MASLVLTITVENDRPNGTVQARTTLHNLSGAQRLQRLCERFGVRPTWLVNYPAAKHSDTEFLISHAAANQGEIGAFLQPWCTPPFDALEDRLTATAPSQIPASMISAKLEHLTKAITDRFGQRPKVHRAAGAGLNGSALQALERLHYTIDTSATPLIDQSAKGGIDWRSAPEVPWFPDRQQPAQRGASPVLEIPESVGWSQELPDFVSRGAAHLPPMARHFLKKLPGGLYLQRLDPVTTALAGLRSFADLQIERGLPCLNLALRSPELFAGTSARCMDAETVDRLFLHLEEFLRYAVDQLRLTPHTLSEFGSWYLNETAFC